MRFFIASLWGLLLLSQASFSNVNEAQLKRQLQQLATAPASASRTQQINTLQTALNWLAESQASQRNIEQYQHVIDQFPQLQQQLLDQLAKQASPSSLSISSDDKQLEQQILQTNSQLLEKQRQLQQQQESLRDLLAAQSQYPLLQTAARRALDEAEKQLRLAENLTNSDDKQHYLLQATAQASKSRVDELALAQLSANNRIELLRLQLQLAQQQYQQLDSQLQQLRAVLTTKRQKEAELALTKVQQLVDTNDQLPVSLQQLLKNNQQFSLQLNQQTQQVATINQQQHRLNQYIQQARKTLNTLQEQAQWLNESDELGETLRAQIDQLPEAPNPRRLDKQLAQLRAERLHTVDFLNQVSQTALDEDSSRPSLSSSQQKLWVSQQQTQTNLLNLLLSGYDNQIVELTKLRVAETQFSDALMEINDAVHRYLFWVADAPPIQLNYPVLIVQHLGQLLSLDMLSQVGHALVMTVTTPGTLLPLLAALLLITVSLFSRRHYYQFLSRASEKIGKVTQDHFALTLRTVLWSILVALPLPVLWAAIGHGLKNAWNYPLAAAIGDGVLAVLPMLWVFMICATFAHPAGLFIAHLRWPKHRVNIAMRYYQFYIWLIVPLIMAQITFDHLNDRQFAASLGRLSFILLCATLSIVTLSLKRAGIPLYLDKSNQQNHWLNKTFWNLLICAPLIGILAAGFGYLSTAQAILGRLESSVAIWFFLLVIYYIIRRWMLLQRRKIAFERAKQKRSEMLAQRAKHQDEDNSNSESLIELEEPVIDLDTISAQSLRLVRSLLTLIALISVVLLWSEIHSAFSFLENIQLWQVSSNQANQPPHIISLGTLLIVFLIFFITLQLVRNLPALLELVILQHLSLTPGTGFAITTLTKYILLLVGGVIGFAWLGIDWGKIQWLIAALGVGLGFGLQEIFANFISGLMILFEKPIRIGDTVTIRELTGTISKINTRATTLIDWDRKEIIMPNKAFITEQFVNWSLSDPITRVVLTIPVTEQADSQLVSTLLVQAAQQSPFVLDTPQPDAYLVDLQQGIQLFELRMYAAEMGHRMPLRHEIHQRILQSLQQHGIEIAYPPLQLRMDSVRKSRKPSIDDIQMPAKGRPYSQGSS